MKSQQKNGEKYNYFSTAENINIRHVCSIQSLFHIFFFKIHSAAVTTAAAIE